MRKYKEVTKTTTTTVLDELSCDICGKVADGNEWEGTSVWDYTMDETEVRVRVTVRQKEGTIFPEGGDGTAYEIDICPDCFKTVLVPFLRSKGAVIEETKWEW